VIGQDISQVRARHAHQRHTALSALAMAILAAAQAQTNAPGLDRGRHRACCGGCWQ
jgi:hypothetical protein